MSDETGAVQPWPARLKPLPDELLTSWIVRLAAAHAIKPPAPFWMSREIAGEPAYPMAQFHPPYICHRRSAADRQ